MFLGRVDLRSRPAGPGPGSGHPRIVVHSTANAAAVTLGPQRSPKVVVQRKANGVIELGPSSQEPEVSTLLGTGPCIENSNSSCCTDAANGHHSLAVNGCTQLMNGHHTELVHAVPSLLSSDLHIGTLEQVGHQSLDANLAPSHAVGAADLQAMRPADTASLDMEASTSDPATYTSSPRSRHKGSKSRARHKASGRGSEQHGTPADACADAGSDLGHPQSVRSQAAQPACVLDANAQQAVADDVAPGHTSAERRPGHAPTGAAQQPWASAAATVSSSSPTANGSRRAGRHAKPAQQQQQGSTQGSGAPRPRRGAPSSSQPAKSPEAALTCAIKGVTSWQQLQQLVERHEASLNHIHVSAMLVQLARLARRLPSPPRQQQQAAATAAPASHQSDSASQQWQQHPQGLPPAQLGAPASQQPEPGSGPGQGQGSSSSSSADEPPYISVRRLSMRLAGLAMKHLKSMTLWEVTGVMSSLVRLRAPLKKNYYVSCMVQALHGFDQPTTTARGLTELIWAVARCGMQGLRADWGASYCKAVAARWHDFDARSGARVLHALAWLQYTPPDAWMAELLAKIQSGLSSGAATSQDVSNTLWALARLRYPVPQPLQSQLAAAAEASFPVCTAEELPCAMWGTARMGAPAPSPAWQAAACSRVLQLLPQLTGQGLALVVYSAGLMGMQPPAGWLGEVLSHAATSGFYGLTPQGMALLVYGASLLPQRPTREWLARFHAHLEVMPGEFRPAAMDLIGTAFSSLAFEPPSRIIDWGPQQDAGLAAARPSRMASTSKFRGAGHTPDEGPLPSPIPSAVPSNGYGRAGGNGSPVSNGAGQPVHHHAQGAQQQQQEALQLEVEAGLEWSHAPGSSNGNGHGSQVPAGEAAGRRAQDASSQPTMPRPVRFAR